MDDNQQRANTICYHCMGTGTDLVVGVTCEMCNGSGELFYDKPRSPDAIPSSNRPIDTGVICEEYYKDPINSIRSFLFRRGGLNPPEWPVVLDDINLKNILTHRTIDILPEPARILLAYANFLIAVNIAGYHDALPAMFDAFLNISQHEPDIEKAIMSKEVEDAYNKCIKP